MAIDSSRIFELATEIQSLTKDIAAKEQRLASALRELKQAAGQQAGSPPQAIRVAPSTPNGATSSAPRARRSSGRRQGATMAAQVIEFLDARPRQNFRTREVAEGLGFPVSRMGSVATTLFILAQRKRIKKGPRGEGFRSVK